MGSYQRVIDILKQAKQDVAEALTSPEDEHHRLKIESALQKNADYLALLTSTGGNEVVKVPIPGPAKTMAGQPIPTKNSIKRADLEPSEEKIKLLRNQVEGMYDLFLTTESLDLLKNYSDDVIRGVAKKAKMKVTKEDPETITLAFIDEIKSNIRIQQKRSESMQKLKENGLEIKAGTPEMDEFYGSEKKETGEQDQKDANNPDPHFNKNSGQWENVPDASDLREEKGIKTPDVAKKDIKHVEEEIDEQLDKVRPEPGKRNKK